MSEGRSIDGTSTQLDRYASHVGENGLNDVQTAICQRVMDGESIRSICRRDGMPSKATVFNWLAQDLTFREAYLLAKQILAEQFAEEIVEISDDSSKDYVDGKNGRELDQEHVQRSRLRVDSRKWLAAKLAPKRYGDASTVTVNDTTTPKREYSRAEIATRLAALARTLPQSDTGED